MAILNVRYGGQITPIDGNSFNFNPSNYGKARLNVKINNSTAKFGLTTNTNAKEYCKFAVRVGGRIAYLGRVSSTQYTSGNSINRNGSSMTSSATEMFTNAAGNGSGTTAANPGIRVVTNATGSSHTTRTASAQIASLTYYWFTFSNNWQTQNETRTMTRTYAATSSSRLASASSRSIIFSQEYIFNSYTGTNYADVTAYHTNVSPQGKTTFIQTLEFENSSSILSSISTARTYTSNSIISSTVVYTTGAWKTLSSRVAGYQTQITRTVFSSYAYRTLFNAKVRTAEKKTHPTKVKSYVERLTLSKQNAVQTAYKYSTRWSYWWTSCKKNTRISETLHNMNI